jgi:hypothetical protein
VFKFNLLQQLIEKYKGATKEKYQYILRKQPPVMHKGQDTNDV